MGLPNDRSTLGPRAVLTGSTARREWKVTPPLAIAVGQHIVVRTLTSNSRLHPLLTPREPRRILPAGGLREEGKSVHVSLWWCSWRRWWRSLLSAAPTPPSPARTGRSLLRDPPASMCIAPSTSTP